MKIRCRSRRTSSSSVLPVDRRPSRWSRPPVRSPRRRHPSGRASTVVSSWCPTCPSVPVSSVIGSSQAHLAHVSTLSGPGSGPVSGRLSGTTGGGADHLSRFPAAFRPPAFASWAILFPPGSSASLTVGLPDACRHRTSTGFPRSARSEIRPGWVPPLPRDGGALPADDGDPRPAPAASHGQSLHPAGTTHRRGSTMTRHHRGFTRVHPSGLPLACAPGWNESPWASPPSFAPRRYQRRTSERGRASSTGPELRLDISRSSNQVIHSISCDFVSHPSARGRGARDAGPGSGGCPGAWWPGGRSPRRCSRRRRSGSPSLR